jgi:hypothetical protein
MYLQKVISRNIFLNFFFLVMTKIAGSGPNPDPDLDLLVRGMDLQTRIRIHTVPNCHESATLQNRGIKRNIFYTFFVNILEVKGIPRSGFEKSSFLKTPLLIFFLPGTRRSGCRISPTDTTYTTSAWLTQILSPPYGKIVRHLIISVPGPNPGPF